MILLVSCAPMAVVACSSGIAPTLLRDDAGPGQFWNLFAGTDLFDQSPSLLVAVDKLDVLVSRERSPGFEYLRGLKPLHARLSFRSSSYGWPTAARFTHVGGAGKGVVRAKVMELLFDWFVSQRSAPFVFRISRMVKTDQAADSWIIVYQHPVRHQDGSLGWRSHDEQFVKVSTKTDPSVSYCTRAVFLKALANYQKLLPPEQRFP